MANSDLPGFRRNGYRPVQRTFDTTLAYALVEGDSDLVVEARKYSEGIWKGFHHLWTGEIPRAAGGAPLIGAGTNRQQSDHPPYAPGTCRTKLGHDPASRLQLDSFNDFLVRSEG